MRWHNFLEAKPADFHDIVIYYQPGSFIDRKFYICKSQDYMNIVGSNNMDLRFAFWTILNLDEIDDYIYMKKGENKK
jgi:hypothetical protein